MMVVAVFRNFRVLKKKILKWYILSLKAVRIISVVLNLNCQKVIEEGVHTYTKNTKVSKKNFSKIIISLLFYCFFNKIIDSAFICTYFNNLMFLFLYQNFLITTWMQKEKIYIYMFMDFSGSKYFSIFISLTQS